ncbi:MAG: hypothetical protein NT066_05010 [Candidatus Omnitrophica bacterium]|nr:hypothetical protein [Candidatus Omnitrophota bacterium]
MPRNLGIIIFGLIEIVIGCVTLTAVILSLLLGKSAKPPEVLIFVLTTSVISLSLGIGILRYNLTSYKILLFFSAAIILSKILIFAKIISLTGALETAVPSGLKDIISIIYHGLLLWYFNLAPIKRRFLEAKGKC